MNDSLPNTGTNSASSKNSLDFDSFERQQQKQRIEDRNSPKLSLYATDNDSQHQFETHPMWNGNATINSNSNLKMNDKCNNEICKSTSDDEMDDCNKHCNEKVTLPETQKIYVFKIVVTPKIKFAVPFDLNKTVNDLVCEIQKRLKKKLLRMKQAKYFTGNKNENDIYDILCDLKPDPYKITTLYFTDYYTLPKSPIYVVLRNSDVLRDIVVSYQVRGKFYWLAAPSPNGMKNVINLLVLCICFFVCYIYVFCNALTPVLFGVFLFVLFCLVLVFCDK